MATLNNTLFLPTNGNLNKSLHCSKPDPFKEKKHAQVDYDAGTHKIYTRIPGLRKLDLPKRQRLRVDGDRFQKDWTLSEVVERITKLKHWEDVEGVLNQWAGRFARKNFPVLMREIIQTGSIEHAIQVFNWMKNQKNYCARNDIYNMLIRLHARHNRIDQARGLFFEMQKWRCNPDVETYNALINAHGRAGQWRWGVNIMEDMLRASSYVDLLAFFLSLYMRMPDVIYAMSAFYLIVFPTLLVPEWRATGFSTQQLPPRIPPSRSTYNNLINACGSSGNWREALKISKKMTDNGVGPDLVTHNIILSAYKTGAQYSKALSYFELMKSTNVRSDTTTLNIVIYCLVKLGKYKEAIEIFNSMREKRAECHPDIVTYTSIMHMYSVCGQIDNCRAIFDALVAEGMKPNVISYNALLGAYASLGLSEPVSSLFDEMKRNGIRPDVVSYTSLINAYGRSGQPKKAWKIFYKMRRDNVSPNLVTYNALIDAYGSNGFLAEAVELLREMEQSGLQPNVVSISTLLAACGRCCQKSKIDSILKAAKMRGIVLNTIAYNSAIGSYMSVGEYDKALCIYRCMRENKIRPDSVTYNILISCSCKMSKFNEALEMISQLRELNIPWSKELYSSAIYAYSKQGQVAEAESIFNMMKGAGFQPDVITYTTMLHAYSVGECWEKGLAIFQEMELNNVQPDSVACAALMRSFNKGSQPGKVLLVAEFMRDQKIPFTDAVFFEMVSSCSILRDWKRLTDVIGMMETTLPLVSVGTLNRVLHSLGKVGNIDMMIKIFLKIVASGAEVDVTTYEVLLQNLLAAGNWRKYIEVMQWMEDAGVQPSAQIYHNILYFAQRSAGIKNAAVIRERIESLKGKSGFSTLETKRFDLPLPTHALISSKQT